MIRRLSPDRWGLYMSVGELEDGRVLAVVSDGCLQLGHDPVTVLTLETFPEDTELEVIQEWFTKVKETRPWQKRS